MDIITAIKEAITYTSRYRGKLVVLYVSSAVIKKADRLFNVLRDIKLLLLAGVRVIVVYPSSTEDRSLWKDLEGAEFIDRIDDGFQNAQSLVRIIRLDSSSNKDREERTVSLAVGAGAEKIVFITDHDGLFEGSGNLLRDIPLTDAKQMLAKGKLSGETARKLKAAIRACENYSARVHIIGARYGSLVKEVFTAEGSGTMIYDQLYHDFRPAEISDVQDIFNIIRTSIRRAPVSFGTLLSEVGSFYVMTIDDSVHGCFSVKDGAEFVEVRYVGTSARFENSEILKMVVDKIIDVWGERTIVLDSQKSSCWLSMYPWFSETGFISAKDAGMTTGTENAFVRRAH